MVDLDAQSKLKRATSGVISLGALVVARLSQDGNKAKLPSTRQPHEVAAAGTPDFVADAHGAGSRRWMLFVAFLPTIFAVFYFGIFASDRYVSEAKFVVKTASKMNDGGGLGSLFHFAGSMSGLSRSQDDNFAVQDFLISRAAIDKLKEKIPLLDIYNRPGADFIAKFPSVFYSKTEDQFQKYFQWMLNININNTTGIATMRVQAFRPEDAVLVAKTLLDLGEDMVNRLNDRIQNDSIRVSTDEVARNEKRMVDAQMALTDFRNRELVVDAAESSVIVTEIIAKLDAERIVTQAQMAQTISTSPDSPQIRVMKGKVDALNGQIADQRRQISEPSTGLASKLASYERLVLEREFAKAALANSNNALDVAKAEARRQQLYLERIVEPHLPDFSTSPERLRMIATFLGCNAILLLVLWLFFMGITEHGAAAK